MLKFTVLLVFTFLSAFFIRQEDEGVISWDEKRPLTWSDFKGKPEKRFAVASTSYEILRSVARINSSAASVKIQAVFFSQNSWKKEKWISDGVLMHEQKHFDIVEIYARKFRRHIQSKNYSSMRQLNHEMDSTYSAMDAELDKYQDQYDDETDSSMNGERQRAWNAKLQKELHALDSYSLSYFPVVFK